MRDILRLVGWCMAAFVLIDPDGSVWRTRSHERQYARVIAACLNGRGFVVSDAIVQCDVTHVEVKR